MGGQEPETRSRFSVEARREDMWRPTTLAKRYVVHEGKVRNNHGEQRDFGEGHASALRDVTSRQSRSLNPTVGSPRDGEGDMADLGP